MLAVTVDDRPLNVGALVERGRVLLPLRATFAALGASVSYEPDGRIIVAENARHALRLRIGAKRALVDGRSVRLTISARIVANRTYVPLRFAAQSFGATVGYDAGAQLVTIVPERTAASAPAGGAGVLSLGPTDGAIVSSAYPTISAPADAGTFYDDNAFAFYTNGPTLFRAGDWMHFTLIAPPGGTAIMQLCGLGFQYPLWGSAQSTIYQANVPAPLGYAIGGCPVTAAYTSWSGQTTYVPIPVYIGIYTAPNGSAPNGTPTPAAHATLRPIPSGPRIPEPVPTPAPLPKPVSTAIPPVHTPVRPPVHPPRPRETP